MKVVIVGGVAGGATAAARIRRLDEKAVIVILERGPYVSFANCGLPYYVGGVVPEKEDLLSQTPAGFKNRFNIDVRTGSEVIGLDTAAHSLRVRRTDDGSEYDESYDKLVLAPGAGPFRPAGGGFDNSRVFTVRTVDDAVRIRNYASSLVNGSVLVAGGGAVGLEMAENLHELGLKVTAAEGLDHLLAPFDAEMTCEICSCMRDRGIDVRLNTLVQSVEEDGNGRLRVSLKRGGDVSAVEADFMIMGLGVRPDTAWLRGSGIKLSSRGAICTDAGMMTSDPDVYAVGDAVETYGFADGEPVSIALAGPAHKQARVAADRICGLDSRFDGVQGTSVVKVFDMTAASTGMSERAAKAAGIEYDKVYLYNASHASVYPGGSMMSLKVLWEKGTERLLGAQIAGFDGVDKRIDVLAAAIRLKAGVRDLIRLELAYAPPFSSAKDPVNYAGMAADNVISGRLKLFYWDDVDRLPRDGSVVLLDVRTPAERSGGFIEGSIHIPLPELRRRIGELPKDKPVYVNCHSGLRSYLACRILTAHGFDCFSLSGGWHLYSSIKKVMG